MDRISESVRSNDDPSSHFYPGSSVWVRWNEKVEEPAEVVSVTATTVTVRYDDSRRKYMETLNQCCVSHYMNDTTIGQMSCCCKERTPSRIPFQNKSSPNDLNYLHRTKARNDPNETSPVQNVSMNTSGSAHNNETCISDEYATENTQRMEFAPDLWKVVSCPKYLCYKGVAQLLPKPLETCCKDVAHFFLFCYERQMIWERRNRGDDFPLTQSWAMSQYFFCNNYRELDRGTNYFRAKILDVWEQTSVHGPIMGQEAWIQKVLWASVCYRLVNKIATFEEFGGIPQVSEWPQWEAFMMNRFEKKIVAFTGAHITMGFVRYCQTMTSLWENNAKLLQDVAHAIWMACCSCDKNERSCHVTKKTTTIALQQCFHAVKSNIPNVGRFLAWQVICDLMESRCLDPCTEYDWTELGPGAKCKTVYDIRAKFAGISTIFANRQTDSSYSDLELAMLLMNIQMQVYDALNIDFPMFNQMHLTLKNIEHPLCEFSKYISIQGALEQRTSVLGHRLNQSRSAMDAYKSCYFFNVCGNSDEILLCDKCLNGYCSDCCPNTKDGGTTSSTSSSCWICPRCTRFEAIDFRCIVDPTNSNTPPQPQSHTT